MEIAEEAGLLPASSAACLATEIVTQHITNDKFLPRQITAHIGTAHNGRRSMHITSLHIKLRPSLSGSKSLDDCHTRLELT